MKKILSCLIILAYWGDRCQKWESSLGHKEVG
jgi:hypothetical protein